MKFLAFTGLRHHLAKLRPVLDELASRGHEVELVTTQNFGGGKSFDFELPLREADLSYTMIDALRGHPDYASGADRRARQLFRRAARRFARGTMPPWYVSGGHYGYAIAEAVETEASFELLLRERRPDAVLVLHEANFWGRCLVTTARADRIPVFSFQEGELADECPDVLLGELALVSEKVFLWGENHVARLTAAGADPSRLMATGPAHLDRILQDAPSPAAARERIGLDAARPTIIGLMARQWAYPLPADFVPPLAAHFSSREHLDLALKWSPGEDAPQREQIDAALTEALGSRYHSLESEDPLLTVYAADVVFGYATTLLTEALALGRPALELAWGNLGRSARHRGLDLGRATGTGSLRGPEDLSEIDRLLSSGPSPEQVEAIAAWRQSRFGDLDGNAATRCTDAILASLATAV